MAKAKGDSCKPGSGSKPPMKAPSKPPMKKMPAPSGPRMAGNQYPDDEM